MVVVLRVDMMMAEIFEIRAARGGSILSRRSNPSLSFSRKPATAVLLPSALA